MNKPLAYIGRFLVLLALFIMPLYMFAEGLEFYLPFFYSFPRYIFAIIALLLVALGWVLCRYSQSTEHSKDYTNSFQDSTLFPLLKLIGYSSLAIIFTLFIVLILYTFYLMMLYPGPAMLIIVIGGLLGTLVFGIYKHFKNIKEKE